MSCYYSITLKSIRGALILYDTRVNFQMVCWKDYINKKIIVDNVDITIIFYFFNYI